MKNNKYEISKPKVEVSKQIELEVHEVEKDAVIVNVDGWRIRVFFGEKLSKSDKEKANRGRTIVASYFGNIEDVHSLRFLPLSEI